MSTLVTHTSFLLLIAWAYRRQSMLHCETSNVDSAMTSRRWLRRIRCAMIALCNAQPNQTATILPSASQQRHSTQRQSQPLVCTLRNDAFKLVMLFGLLGQGTLSMHPVGG